VQKGGEGFFFLKQKAHDERYKDLRKMPIGGEIQGPREYAVRRLGGHLQSFNQKKRRCGRKPRSKVSSSQKKRLTVAADEKLWGEICGFKGKGSAMGVHSRPASTQKEEKKARRQAQKKSRKAVYEGEKYRALYLCGVIRARQESS